ncbi:MAG: hypothetical protein NT028_09950 [candidate division Zixibacteria bacterium]|nr:hypothetical protein [candidate division Zixibacteria bacterium]
MKCTNVFWIVVWAAVALWSFPTLGAVPQSISYQGQLSSAGGGPVNDTVDLVFSICPDSLCDRPLWTESHSSVIVKDGLFDVLLGSITPIPPSVFLGSVRWLSISKDGVAASRALRMVSAPYAYRSLLADTAYYAKSGGGSDCSDCDSIFVNAIGPDSVIATSGTALTGSTVGSGGADIFGIKGYASNKGTGTANGGLFTTADSGSGFHFGVRGEAYSTVSMGAYGVAGYGSNTSGGEAYGGYFATPATGTGHHYGLRASAMSASPGAAYGIYGTASNSFGQAYGGFFSTSSEGEGIHYGISAEAHTAALAFACGIDGYAVNTSSGAAYGGSFETADSGTGIHYGIKSSGAGASSSTTYGVSGVGSNTSTGTVLGGEFSTSLTGTGDHYGIKGSGYGNSDASTYGSYGYGKNFLTGSVYGGFFETSSSGTGTKYGIYSVTPAAAGYAGYFAGNTLTTGTKSAAVKVDNGEYRLLYAMESPENWFEDFGGGKLQDGVTTVQIDPLFAQAVNIQIEYRVYLTPEGDCRGLYVTNKGASSFEVRELQGGTANISFSYRIVAKRKGYEDLRMAKMLGSTPEETEAVHAKRQAEMEEDNQRIRQDRSTPEKDPSQQERK